MSREEFDKKYNGKNGKGNMVLSEDTNRGKYSKASQWMNKINGHRTSNIYL